MKSVENQNTNNKHFLWWLVVLGIIGLSGYLLRADNVFPSASIDLSKSKAELVRTSNSWAKTLGYNTNKAISSTVFSFDDDAKTFLEYELGLSEANKLMKEQIPIWYWSTRFCHPFMLEEFNINLSPTGELVYFDHSYENDHAMPSIDHGKALELAQNFIKQQINQNFSFYHLVEDGVIAQSHRTDHYFTFENDNLDVKGAHLRVYVYISGNQITGYNRYLNIPESWTRKFSELRSYNKALEEIASIFYNLFSVTTFFIFIWAFTTGKLRWRFAGIIALIVALFDFAESLNSFPTSIHNYTTVLSFSGYIIETHFSAILSALNQFLQTFTLVGAAEALYRLAYPNKISLENIATRLGTRCRETLLGLCAGCATFGVHLGWITTYYLAGRQFGFWSPLEVRNTEALSTTFPFFSAMNVGLTASIFEELTYRVLGLVLFQKWCKNFWVANLLQAAAWAFMHSNYAQEPPYARGIELTVVGFLYGAVLRKYGLLACIIAHYTFDAFLGVTPLITSWLLSLKLSAFIAVAPAIVFLLIVIIAIKKQGYLSNESVLSNSNISAPHIAPELEEILVHEPFTYEPLSIKKRIILVAITIMATIVQFGYFFPTIGSNCHLSTDRVQATAIARKYLIDQHIIPTGLTESTLLTKGIDTEQFQYIFEKANQKKANSLAQFPGQPLVWHARFFRPLDPQEYMVTLNASGVPLSLSVTKSETASGAKLKEAQAQRLVQEYLNREHTQLNPMVLDDAVQKQRKLRTDYNFRFDAPKFDVVDAKFKVETDTIGDTVANYDQYWDIPDNWLFQHKRTPDRVQVFRYVLAVAGLAALLFFIWWAIGVAKSGAIRFRPAFILCLIPALIAIPQAINDLPQFYEDYATDTPLFSYFTTQFINQAITVFYSMAIVAALAAFAFASFRIISARQSARAILIATFQQSNKALWLDAVLCGYAAGVGLRAMYVILSAAHAYFSPTVAMAPLDNFSAMANVISPWLDCFLEALTTGLQTLLLTGVAVGLYAKFFRNFRQYLIFIILISLLIPSTDRYWQNYVMSVISNLVFALGMWVFIAKFARKNFLAYILAGVISIISAWIRIMSINGAALFSQDITLLVIVLMIPFVFMVISLLPSSANKPS